MITSSTGARWRPTAAHVRAVAVGAALAGAAVLLGRPDLLVLAAPLLLAAAGGRLGRPVEVPVGWTRLVRAGLERSRWRDGRAPPAPR